MLLYATLFLIAVGEFLLIYSEQLGAKLYGLMNYSFLSAFSVTLVPALIGAVCLVAGYMFGLKHFQNIWSVTAISFGTILFVEPLFNYFFIGHIPDTSEAIGVILGALGIVAVVFF
jgi:hypothetical protein